VNFHSNFLLYTCVCESKLLEMWKQITLFLVFTRGVYFRFGSVFIKKRNQTEFFFKKKTRTETGSNRPVSVRFGFLEQKPVQTGLAWFFRFGSVLARFGSVFFRFFRFGFGSIRFGFFVSRLKKLKPNRTSCNETML